MDLCARNVSTAGSQMYLICSFVEKAATLTSLPGFPDGPGGPRGPIGPCYETTDQFLGMFVHLVHVHTKASVMHDEKSCKLWTTMQNLEVLTAMM